MQTTKELMERIRTGDLAAYRELFRQNAGTVYQNAFQATHDRDAARRITRDTFREIAEKLRSAPESGWQLWLETLAEKNAAFASLTRGEVSEIEAELFAQERRETSAHSEDDPEKQELSPVPAVCEATAPEAAPESEPAMADLPKPEPEQIEPEAYAPETTGPDSDPREALKALFAQFGIADAGEPAAESDVEADFTPEQEPFAPEIAPEEQPSAASGQAETEPELASMAESEPESAARSVPTGAWSPTLRPTQPLSEIRRYAVASAEPDAEALAEPEKVSVEPAGSQPAAEKSEDDAFESLWRLLHLEDDGAETEKAVDSPAPEPAAPSAEPEREQEFAWTARASETDEERRARLREAVRREAEGDGAFGNQDAFREEDTWDADGEPTAAPVPVGKLSKKEKKGKKQRTRAAGPALGSLLSHGALMAGILALLWLALGLLHALGVLPGLNLGYDFLEQLF